MIQVKLRSKYLLKKQVIQWNIPDTLPDIMCSNKHAVDGILTNILDNAIKFTPESGMIVVSVVSSLVSEEQETDDNTLLTITIADSGPGIPKEKQDVIFERFEDRGTRPTSSNTT